MQVADACLVERTPKLTFIIRELHAVSHQDVACTTHAGACAITVLGDLETRTCHNEAGASAYVEGVLSVTASSYDIERIVITEVNTLACFKQTVAKAEQLIDRSASCLQNSQHSCNLFGGIGLTRDAHQNVMCVLP